jgi:hypothetical protein
MCHRRSVYSKAPLNWSACAPQIWDWPAACGNCTGPAEKLSWSSMVASRVDPLIRGSLCSFECGGLRGVLLHTTPLCEATMLDCARAVLRPNCARDGSSLVIHDNLSQLSAPILGFGPSVYGMHRLRHAATSSGGFESSAAVALCASAYFRPRHQQVAARKCNCTFPARGASCC